MDFTEEQEIIKNSAKEFLQAECPKTLVRELENSQEGYSPKLWEKVADLGWPGLIIPEEYGGAGMSFQDLTVLFEQIGYNLFPGPLFSTIIGAFMIIEAGTEEQKSHLLTKLAEGKLKLSLALTEPSATYNPAGVTVEAVEENGDYIINGTKLFVENAHTANYLICVARTGKGEEPRNGITLFIVDAKTPGVNCSVIPTIAHDKQCEVAFKDVRASRGIVLGDPGGGWDIVEKILARAAVIKCAEMVGGMQACLEMTNAYVKERIAYGKQIASFQVIQHNLANVWLNVETARNITCKAAWMIGENLPAAGLEASIAKAWVGEAFISVAERCLHMHGAIGTTEEHDMGLYYRRAKAYDLAYGNGDHHRDLIACRSFI